jgi:hypothetical protein
MTKNTKTKNYRIPADQIQNLEIDRNGRVAPRLHDLEPLKNTLLSVLYPGIKVASVNVPTEILDDYEESQVENRLAKLVWNGIHYKLVGASGSAKKGKFYFVDQEHSRAIAERFQHWPQAAIVYFGILVSSCKVMMEEPDARVLVVPDGKLGTNDCRGMDQAQPHSFLARRSAMLQLCSNPAAVVGGYTETPAKFEALDSLLTELIRDHGEKIVLWSFYTKTIDALMVRYGQYQPVRYDGQVADLSHRRAAVKNFQEDDETILFIGNPAAAGAGLTLHRSRTAIYESFSNQAAHY